MEQIMGYELVIYFRFLWAKSLSCLALVFKGRLDTLLKETWDKIAGKYNAREEAFVCACLTGLTSVEPGRRL